MDLLVTATFLVQGETVYAHLYMEDEDGWLPVTCLVEELKTSVTCTEVQVSRRTADGSFELVNHVSWLRTGPSVERCRICSKILRRGDQR